jgi:hypothetical protein
MDNEGKKKILELLKGDYIATPSLRKLQSNTGISTSYLSQMLQKDYDPGDETWNKLATYYNVEISEYQIVKTKNLVNIQILCDIAREERAMMCVIGEAGQGKTTSLMDYARKNPGNTVYIMAEKELSKTFLYRLCEALNTKGSNWPNVAFERIRDKLGRMNQPLVIIDEASKLPPAALMYIREIYLERRLSYSGIILAGVPCLELNILKWARLNRPGFVELLDRIQQPFIHLDPPSRHEVEAICVQNKVDPGYIPYAVRESERSASFRSIERAVTNARIIKTLQSVKYS